MGSRSPRLTPVDALSLLTSGELVIRVSESPLLSVRSDERTLDIDVTGAKRAGLRLSRIIEAEGARMGVVREAAALGRRLSDVGWTLTLRDGEERLVSLGRGASSLTGHVRLNPARLGRLLAALR